MSKKFLSFQFAILFIGLVVAATLTAAQEPKGSVREKRGYGHGHGKNSKKGQCSEMNYVFLQSKISIVFSTGHGHGPGAGGGARGPIYFCGWVGSKEGSQGYGHHG